MDTIHKRAFTLIEVIFVTAIAAIVLGVFIPRYAKARATAARNSCINNMSQAQGAKESWALLNKKTPSAPVAWSNITPYLKSHSAPVCPSGGTYNLGAAGTNITCSIPGHMLPANAFHKFP